MQMQPRIDGRRLRKLALAQQEMRQERHAYYAGLRRTKPAPLDQQDSLDARS